MPKQEYKERTPEFFKFEDEGTELEGVYVGAATIDVRGTPTLRHSIQTVDGAKSFLGGVQLDSLLTEEVVGQQVKLQFTGLTPTAQGRSVKEFRLWVMEG